jgi:bifunctional non-homologous end joining protein LigD
MAKKRAPTTAHAPSQTPQSSDALAVYRSKRDFGKTPEPPPKSSPIGANKGKKTALAFVVQKHDATRLHYDVRLEIGGAMMSWAVPKGPSFDPSVRRLAVETEDHPIEYNAFEGRIPDGEYGAGDVLIWDRGTYESVPPGQEETMRDKGHFHVRLAGEKLKGEWHIIRTGRRAEGASVGESGARPQWLMFKAKDAHANPKIDIVADRPESVVSGRTATRGPLRVHSSSSGKSVASLVATVGDVMLATPVEALDDPDKYLFEIKYDGYRLLAVKVGREVRLLSRRTNDWTPRFVLIADAIARLPVLEAVIDGEACAVDDKGRPSFARLQQWLSGETAGSKLAYAAFDLLWLDGRDLRKEPIEVRRELLEALLADAPAPLSFSRSMPGEVTHLLEVAKRTGLEGLIGKRKGTPYLAGRGTAWVKLKFERHQDCAIAGYIPMNGTTNQVGALVLALAEEGRFVYAGRVGTGFDSRTRIDLAKRLDALPSVRATIHGVPKTETNVHWTEPTLVCEIGFAEWTRDGSARQPKFLGLREDKTPLECIREPDAVDIDPRAVSMREPVRVALANPDKVLFPRDGITKREIFDYYTAIAPVLLPHLAGRPLALQRWVNGIDEADWYQQNAPLKVPDFVRLVDVGERHRNKKRMVAEKVETLQWMANLAALTIHQWASHVPEAATTHGQIVRALGQPDYFVLDLDPGEGTWANLIEVALTVRKLVEALEFESCVKTSGKRGLHIVIPVAPGPSHEEATRFAEQMARAVAKALPDIATVERMKAKRHGRLYVDYGQNGEGRTIVSPYTIRALDGAPVSTPLAWSEVTVKLDPKRFTIRTILDRIHKLGDLFVPALSAKNVLPPLA